MTTATLLTGERAINAADRPRRSLEHLVDRLFEAMGFGAETDEASVTRSIHEARRFRKAGDMDGALATLGSVNVATATPSEARWAFSEWSQLVKRRFGRQDVLVHSQGVGRAAALLPNGDGLLEVAAVLEMRWRPRKVLSERSLRGLRPLAGLPLTRVCHPRRVTPGGSA